MERKYQAKPNWQTALSAFVIGIGVIGLCPPSEAISVTPVLENSAAEENSSSLKLAQVGIRSRINAPTPLNITPPPGTHIPLPSNSYYHRNRSYHNYQRNPRQGYYYRRSRNHGRHNPYYEDHHYRGTVRKRSPQRRSRGVIIIKSNY